MRRPLPLLLCFGFPALVAVGGLIGAGLYAARVFPPLFEDEVYGELPGPFQFTLEEEGRYTIWNYTGNLGSEQLSESIYLFDHESGDSLPISWGIHSTKSLNGVSAHSIGTFEQRNPGRELELKGSGPSGELRIGISPVRFQDVMGSVITLLGIALISLSAAIGLFIALLHRRQKQIEQRNHT
ncbi:MAG: hypothetical protein AAF236_11500 [Verrucomicrobiota bacterium]